MPMMKRLTIKGETIVEVLIVTLILTSVMATVFGITTRTLNQDRASQERTEAASYAQDQIERLVVATSNGIIKDPTLLPTNFCLIDVPDPSVTPVLLVASITSVPAGCQSNRYSGYFSYDNATRVYTETVYWDNASGGKEDNVKLLYRTEYVPSNGLVVPPPVLPPLPVDPCPPSGIPTGSMQACYYNDTNNNAYFTAFGLNRNESPGGGYAVNNNWATGSPGAGVNADDFSARYQGKFNFAGGTYRFTMGGDDGIRLYIDGAAVPIINQWRDQSYTQYSVDAAISAGLHDVKMEFYERAGDARAVLYWVPVTVLEAETFTPAGGVFPGGSEMIFASNGNMTKTVSVPAFSKISVTAKGDQHPAGPPQMSVYINGAPIITNANVTNTSYQPYTANVSYPAGTYTFTVSFNNDMCGPPCGGGNPDRNIYVDNIILAP